MVMVEMKNIMEDSDAMFFITGLIGLRVVRIFRTKFFGYFYVALLLVVYYASYFYTIIDGLQLYETMRIYSMSMNLRIVQTFFNLIYLPIIIFSSIKMNSKIHNLYNELLIVDEKLKLLNIRFHYYTFFLTDILEICQIIIVTIVFNVLEYFSQINLDTKNIFILFWIVNTFPQFVNTIAITCFVIVIWKIQRRLEEVNKLIQSMSIFEKTDLNDLEMQINNGLKLRLLGKIHKKIIDATIHLNEAYGFIIITSFVIYFITCCGHLRTIAFVFGQLENIADFTIETLWVGFYISKYHFVIKACHNLTIQGKLSGKLLYEKWTDVDHHPFKQEGKVLARQIDRRNLQLTASDFFVIDYPLFFKIVGALAAYLVFVAQFSTLPN